MVDGLLSQRFTIWDLGLGPGITRFFAATITVPPELVDPLDPDPQLIPVCVSTDSS